MDISHYSSPLYPDRPQMEPRAPAAPAQDGGTQPAATESEGGDSLFGALIDTINPLQHIPGVSSVYREATGDSLNPLASMAGGFLFGGPVGLIAGAAGSFLEMLTGKDAVGLAMSMFGGDEDQGAAQTPEGSLTGEPLLQADPGLSLAQYQAFAQASTDNHTGIGAEASTVALSANTWSLTALQQAAGLYETSQALGDRPGQRADIAA